MSNSELSQNSSNSMLEKGLDIMRDPKTSKGAKAGAVALVAIGAVVYLGYKAMEIIGQDKQ